MIVRDSCGKVHPWENNDGVYWSINGTPCREVSRNRDSILLEFARLTKPSDFEIPNLRRLGQWTIFQGRINIDTFLNQYTCS